MNDTSEVKNMHFFFLTFSHPQNVHSLSVSQMAFLLLYNTILYYTILYYTTLYYTLLYYTILYYTIILWLMVVVMVILCIINYNQFATCLIIDCSVAIQRFKLKSNVGFVLTILSMLFMAPKWKLVLWWNIPCEWIQVRRLKVFSRNATKYNIYVKIKRNTQQYYNS